MALQVPDAICSYSAHKGHFTRTMTGANTLMDLLTTGFANDSYQPLSSPWKKKLQSLSVPYAQTVYSIMLPCLC